MRFNVLIWDTSIAEMLCGGHFGGIAVQLKFWGEAFMKNGASVHSLTYRSSFERDGFIFHKIVNKRNFNLVLEWIYAYRLIRELRPKYVLIRGAQRALYPLVTVARLFDAKVIFFGASDVNFIPGKASVGNGLNQKMYEKGLDKVPVIVTQNEFQKNTLFSNYGKSSVVIPNIWPKIAGGDDEEKCYDVVWIANFRRLKRAEWVMELARQLPDVKFVMAGGANDFGYFSEIRSLAIGLKNVEFLGPVSFEKSNELIRHSKILLCTSEYEGFPNTFLQAWAANVPVLSTVDPNGVIEGYELGKFCCSVDEMVSGIHELLGDRASELKIMGNIERYFSAYHSFQKGYDDLIRFLNENESDTLFNR